MGAGINMPACGDGLNGPGSAGSPIPSTYTELVTLSTGGGLIPGQWYSFEYKCIHTIMFTLIQNDSVFPVDVETFRIQAFDTTSFFPQVHSEQHPDDIIMYNIDRLRWGNFTNLNSRGFVSYRRIYYKNDAFDFNDNSTVYIEADFDIRGAVYARWHSDDLATITGDAGFDDIPCMWKSTDIDIGKGTGDRKFTITPNGNVTYMLAAPVNNYGATVQGGRMQVLGPTKFGLYDYNVVVSDEYINVNCELSGDYSHFANVTVYGIFDVGTYQVGGYLGGTNQGVIRLGSPGGRNIIGIWQGSNNGGGSFDRIGLRIQSGVYSDCLFLGAYLELAGGGQVSNLTHINNVNETDFWRQFSRVFFEGVNHSILLDQQTQTPAYMVFASVGNPGGTLLSSGPKFENVSNLIYYGADNNSRRVRISNMHLGSASDSLVINKSDISGNPHYPIDGSKNNLVTRSISPASGILTIPPADLYVGRIIIDDDLDSINVRSLGPYLNDITIEASATITIGNTGNIIHLGSPFSMDAGECMIVRMVRVSPSPIWKMMSIF